MLKREFRHRSTCPACAVPTPAPELCADCSEAFAVARAVHPSSTPGHGQAAGRRLADDLDLWDAWALLGDAGDRAGRFHPD
ncbi:MAG: hypothetical protein ACRD07_12800 [Acidimicrobiales bacterium]